MTAPVMYQTQLQTLESGLKNLKQSKMLIQPELKTMLSAIETHHRNVKLCHLTGQTRELLEQGREDTKFYYILTRLLIEIQNSKNDQQRSHLKQVFKWYQGNKHIVTHSGPKFGRQKTAAVTSDRKSTVDNLDGSFKKMLKKITAPKQTKRVDEFEDLDITDISKENMPYLYTDLETDSLDMFPQDVTTEHTVIERSDGKRPHTVATTGTRGSIPSLESIAESYNDPPTMTVKVSYRAPVREKRPKADSMESLLPKRKSVPLSHLYNPHARDLNTSTALQDNADTTYTEVSSPVKLRVGSAGPSHKDLSEADRLSHRRKWDAFQQEHNYGQDMLSKMQYVGRNGLAGGVRYTAHDNSLYTEDRTKDVIMTFMEQQALQGGHDQGQDSDLRAPSRLADHKLEQFYEFAEGYYPKQLPKYPSFHKSPRVKSAPCAQRPKSSAKSRAVGAKPTTDSSSNPAGGAQDGGATSHTTTAKVKLDTVVGMIDTVMDDMTQHKEKLAPEPQPGFRQPVINVDLSERPQTAPAGSTARPGSPEDYYHGNDPSLGRTPLEVLRSQILAAPPHGAPYPVHYRQDRAPSRAGAVIEAIDWRGKITPDTHRHRPDADKVHDSVPEIPGWSSTALGGRANVRNTSVPRGISLRTAGSTHAGNRPRTAPITPRDKWGREQGAGEDGRRMASQAASHTTVEVDPAVVDDLVQVQHLGGSSKKRRTRHLYHLDYYFDDDTRPHTVSSASQEGPSLEFVNISAPKSITGGSRSTSPGKPYPEGIPEEFCEFPVSHSPQLTIPSMGRDDLSLHQGDTDSMTAGDIDAANLDDLEDELEDEGEEAEEVHQVNFQDEHDGSKEKLDTDAEDAGDGDAGAGDAAAVTDGVTGDLHDSANVHVDVDDATGTHGDVDDVTGSPGDDVTGDHNVYVDDACDDTQKLLQDIKSLLGDSAFDDIPNKEGKGSKSASTAHSVPRHKGVKDSSAVRCKKQNLAQSEYWSYQPEMAEDDKDLNRILQEADRQKSGYVPATSPRHAKTKHGRAFPKREQSAAVTEERESLLAIEGRGTGPERSRSKSASVVAVRSRSPDQHIHVSLLKHQEMLRRAPAKPMRTPPSIPTPYNTFGPRSPRRGQTYSAEHEMHAIKNTKPKQYMAKVGDLRKDAEYYPSEDNMEEVDSRPLTASMTVKKIGRRFRYDTPSPYSIYPPGLPGTPVEGIDFDSIGHYNFMVENSNHMLAGRGDTNYPPGVNTEKADLSPENMNAQLSGHGPPSTKLHISYLNKGRPIADYLEHVEPEDYNVAMEIQKQAKAAADIQRIFRGYVARNRYKHLLKEERERRENRQMAAVEIQKAYRGHLVRKRAIARRAPNPETLAWAKGYRISLVSSQKGRQNKADAVTRENARNKALSDSKLSIIGPHVEVYDPFHPKHSGAPKSLMRMAATLLQKHIRGWLIRVKVKKLKRKAKQLCGSWGKFIAYYRSFIFKIQMRLGIDKPEFFFSYDIVNNFIDTKRYFESVFDKKSFGGEMELDDLSAMFKECDLFPSQSEVDNAFDLVFRGQPLKQGRGLHKNEVIEMIFQIYPPKGTGLQRDRRSTWMTPIIEGEEALKLVGTEGVESTDFKTCWKIVADSRRERNIAETQRQEQLREKEWQRKHGAGRPTTKMDDTSSPKEQVPSSAHVNPENKDTESGDKEHSPSNNPDTNAPNDQTPDSQQQP